MSEEFQKVEFRCGSGRVGGWNKGGKEEAFCTKDGARQKIRQKFSHSHVITSKLTACTE